MVLVNAVLLTYSTKPNKLLLTNFCKDILFRFLSLSSSISSTVFLTLPSA